MYVLKLLICELSWFMFIVYAYMRRHNFIFYFAFICLHVFFYVVCIVVVSTFLRLSLFEYEHDVCAFLGSVDTDD